MMSSLTLFGCNSFHLTRMDNSFNPTAYHRKDKVIFVMGATGTGKSKLAIHLATQFSGEIINSDKMQVYKGLDVVTNKMTEEERRGVRHHLFDFVNPTEDYTASDFCNDASLAIWSVIDRGNIPIIAGGSNSYIEALVDWPEWRFRSKYECCFLWVDVAEPVLQAFVSDRVDEMVEAGLVDEVREMFHPDADYTRGIRLSIGVPEMDRYFRVEGQADSDTMARMLEEAIDEIKSNTWQLTRRQRGKICRLRGMRGWDMHRLEATEAVAAKGAGREAAWEEDVAGPATAIVNRFLYGHKDIRKVAGPIKIGAGTVAREITMPALVAGTTR